MKYQYEPLGDEYEFQEFLRDLFNCQYGTTSFEIYGSKGNSQYGVDVYSPLLKIAVQAKKKDLTRRQPELERELLKDLKETANAVTSFPHQIDVVFVATTTKKFVKVQDAAFTHSKTLDKPFHFYSWKELEEWISRCPHIRSKYYPHLATHGIPKELVAMPVIDMAAVIGRDMDRERLEQILHTNRAVCVQSVGGVGKTTFVRAFYQENIPRFDFLVWLECTSDYKKAWGYSESLATSFQLTFDESDSDEKRYQTVLKRVIGLPGRALVVIDNLQHEPNTIVENEVRKLLANSELKVLITSRQPFESMSSFLLDPVDVSSAREIFLRNCPKTIDVGRLDELLTLVGCNALLTELLAKTIYSDFGLTIDEVIVRLVDGDIEESLQVEVEQYSNGEVLVSSVYNHLLRVVDIEKLDGDYEYYLIFLLCILPSANIPIEDIFSVFLYREQYKAKVLNAINTLHKKGLLVRNGDFVKMHRLIQDVVRMQVPSYVVFADVFNSLARSILRANQAFSKIGYKIVLYAESILAKVRGEKAAGMQQPLLLIKNNLYPMYRYLGQKEKTSKLGPELIAGLELEEPTDSMSRQFNHSLHHNVATYYYDTENLPEAEKHFKRAIEINGSDYNLGVISSYLGLYDVYHKQERFKDGMECASKTLEVFKSFPDEGHDDVWATISSNLAFMNWEFGNKDEAVGNINIALQLYRGYKGERKNNAMLAGLYANAAMIYSGMGGHEVAIQFALHAIHYRLKLELENDSELLAYYKIAAKVYENAGSTDEAARLRELIRTLSSKNK